MSRKYQAKERYPEHSTDYCNSHRLAHFRTSTTCDDKRPMLNPKELRPYAATVAKRLGYGIERQQVALARTSVTTTEGYVQKHETPVSEVSVRLPERKPKY